MVSRKDFVLLLLFAALFVGSCNMAPQSSVAEPVEQISTPAPNITCDQLVTLAETTVGLVCNGLGRNQACYGNRLISVEFQPNTNLTFVTSGDKVDLLSIRRLSTSPLNMETKDWGIAVLKAQANLPDALPGQNVTFLMFGDTTIDNPSPDMRAVTVSTRIGETQCTDAPSSAVLIQSPEGAQVAMNINGADVILGSTAYITTNAETQRMTFAVLEGTGVISAFNTTQIVQPGMKTGIALGAGPDGLQASGPPNEPAPYDFATIQHAPVNLLERKIVIPPAGSAAPTTNTATPTTVSPQPTVETACVPRSDWPYRYVIQRGDNLSTIALKLNVRTADLQAGNCIDNPNALIAGQSILVPRPVPTPIPPTPTATPTNVPPPQPTDPNLRADKNPIGYKECTTIRWDVEGIKAVYFEGQGVSGHDSRQVCPSETTTYTLLVIWPDDSRHPYSITINIQAVCGNQVCEPGESYSTCYLDCVG